MSVIWHIQSRCRNLIEVFDGDNGSGINGRRQKGSASIGRGRQGSTDVDGNGRLSPLNAASSINSFIFLLSCLHEWSQQTHENT